MKTFITITLFSILNWRKNLISILISLEMIPLTIFLMLSNLNKLTNEISLIMLLIIMVTTSVTSITMMVSISRTNKTILLSSLWPLK